MSSVKSRSCSISVCEAFAHNVVSSINQSIQRQKRKGDNMHPFLTPVFISKSSVRYWPLLTLDLKLP